MSVGAAGPLVVTYPLSGRSRAIVAEELGGAAAAVYLADLAPPERAAALRGAGALLAHDTSKELLKEVSGEQSLENQPPRKWGHDRRSWRRGRRLTTLCVYPGVDTGAIPACNGRSAALASASVGDRKTFRQFNCSS
ncbi:MAG TPA: hypothetical protein VGJ20_23685, partial [Xanthobacteraceae bacterium]